MGQCPCTTVDAEPEEPTEQTPPQPEEPTEQPPSHPPSQPPPQPSIVARAVNQYSFHELKKATKNFSDELLIRATASGPIFRGTLQSNNQVVAIQWLRPKNVQSKEAFHGDVQILSRQHHPNLINLLGYCTKKYKHHLVFEYVPSDLESRLHAPPTPEMEPLTWSMRMRIAAGVARGLNFLHNEADPPVIYGDLKSSNVLLLDSLDPKLSDVFRHNNPESSTSRMDSQGYRAPECSAGQSTIDSDIYSFGILMLELMTGKRAFDDTRGSGNELLADWALPKLRNWKYNEVIDPVLKGKCPASSFDRAVLVVWLTTLPVPRARLKMPSVVQFMNSVIDRMQVPQPGDWDGEWSNTGAIYSVAGTSNAPNTST